MKVICPYCAAEVDVIVGAQQAEAECHSCGKLISTEETLDFVESTVEHASQRPPRTIGRFQVLEPLSSGSTARVFKGRETDLDQIVAIKLFYNKRKQLLREAQVASKLRHPNIVAVYEAGIDDGRYYIVSECIDGETLAEANFKNQLTAPEIAALCAKLADALDYAHAQNVVHRDIKPSNILIDSLGEPHIADFGVALETSAANDIRQGFLLGTPTYMSPEQARGDAHLADARTDIYALGTIMYELLSGRVPHQGELATLLRSIAEAPPPSLNSKNGRVPPELEAICLKCLEKDPRDRFQSAKQLADMLRQFQASQQSTAILIAELRRLRAESENAQQESVEHRRMFLAAQSEHRSFQELVEDLPLCVFRKDAEGRFLFANDAFCETVRQSAGNLVGMSSREVLPEQLAKEHEKLEAEVISTGRVMELTEEYATDGETKTFEVQRSPFRSFEGTVVGVQTIMWDVSAHARVQRALREAKEAAESASQAKSEFIAKVSHEIRTPMQGIIGLTDLLLRRRQSAKDEDLLRTIQESADALLTIINDILDFSRHEATHVNVESVDFDIHDTVSQLSKLFEHECQDKGVELTCEIDSGVPQRCVGDVTLVRRVLMNIIGNAVKFTSVGRIELIVRKALIAESGGGDEDRVNLHFTVSDTGIGIPDDKCNSIFKPFEQVDASITRRRGGTGLGLAICSELIHLMGGKVWVESEVGKGSTFHVLLTLGQGREPPELRDPIVPSDFGDRQTPQLRVLLVEDHPVNQKFAVLALEDSGHAVTVASTGRQAVDICQRQEFDVILMDLQMPEMDGITATAEIRKSESKGHVPIVAMTAHASEEDRDKCLAAGMDACIFKPIRHHELLTVLGLASSNQAVSKKSESEVDTPYKTFHSRQLMQRVDGDMEFLRSNLEMFQEDYASLQRLMAEALEKRSFDRLVQAVHKLNGTVRNFAAITAVGTLSELESVAQNQDLSAIEELWSKAQEEIAGLLNELVIFLAREDR